MHQGSCCGMSQLSDEDRRRIYEEEKVRDEARTRIKQDRQAKVGLGCLGVLTIFGGLVALVFFFGGVERPALSYTMLEERANRCCMNAVVAVGADATRDQVATLAKYLRDHEWHHERINIQIYNDAGAWKAYQECVFARRATRTDAEWDKVDKGPLCVRGQEALERNRIASADRRPNLEPFLWLNPNL